LNGRRNGSKRRKPKMLKMQFSKVAKRQDAPLLRVQTFFDISENKSGDPKNG
jgi:hypothetical protein